MRQPFKKKIKTMRKILFFSITFLLVMFVGCKDKVEIFNGEIILINKANLIDSLKAERIELDGIYTGYMAVYDSLMFFLSSKYPDNYLHIFNINTGQPMGSYCKKGEGPSEFYYFTHNEQYENIHGDIKLWGYNDLDNIYLLNITQSVRANSTCVEQTIDHNWRKVHTRPWATYFMRDNNVLVKSQPEYLDDDESALSLGSYSLYNLTVDSLLREYRLYNRMPDIEDPSPFLIENIFYSDDKIDVDKKKIAMAMNLLAQINILDLETGTLRGFRLKESPDFDEFTKKSYTPTIYYTDLNATAEFLYALYSEIELDGSRQYPFESREIHVFDWNGNMLRQIILEHKAREIAIDHISGYLYTINEMEEIFRYKL